MTYNKKIFEYSWLCVLFAVAVVSLFVLQPKKSGFDNYPHGYLSAHGMALAENLLKTDNLFMYNSVSYADGKMSYDAYNRFSPFSFLLIRGVSSFGKNYDMRIYLARQLVNMFFVISIGFVFCTARILARDNIVALSSVFAVFSSFYYLHYSNMIFVDIFSLCFFCASLFMVIAVLRDVKISRFWLGAVVVLSALTAWQSGAVYCLWFFIEVFKKITKNKNHIKTAFWCFAGFAVVSVGIFALQLYSEYMVVGGDFLNIPTVKSVLFRLGVADSKSYELYDNRLSFFYFATKESFRIVRLLFPGYLEIYWSAMTASLKMMQYGYFFVVALVFLFLLNFKNKIIHLDELVLLMLSGFFWTVPMRMHVAFHDFQSIFYVGIPLCFYLLLFDSLNRIKWFLLHATCLMFIVNAVCASMEKDGKQKHAAAISCEFDNIKRVLPENAKVYVADKDFFKNVGKKTGTYPVYAIDYYLAGSIYSSKEQADYVIALGDDYNGSPLTENDNINLFENRG